MTSIGLMSLEDRARVDFARLRRSRRERLFEAMQARELDALVLGRPANIRFASGARQLWTAGVRPFAPGCVVVRSTGAVHLLSVWDEGVPAEVAHEQLFGLSWDPANLTGALQAVPGLADAARVGTDGLTPLFAELLRAVVPRGAIVSGTDAIWQARRVKDIDEIGCIATATAAAEAALSAMIGAASPGTTERQLLAVFAGVQAALGLPPLASESVAFVSTGVTRLRHLATDRPIRDGDLVALNPGGLYAGYEGGVGRTIVAGSPNRAQAALAARAVEAHASLIAACRSGRSGRELTRGAPPSTVPLVIGIGLGAEPPVIGAGTNGETGGSDVLAPGLVLSVQSWTPEPELGGVLMRDVVLVTEQEPEVLSRYAAAP